MRRVEDIVDARLIVGMEVHVELATRTKVFAGAGNPAGVGVAADGPNTLIDPVVLGLPGALPVLNGAAVEMAMRVGLALGCRIAERTKWDRKGYFYPDLPKGYQISQYDLSLCYDGAVEVVVPDAGDPAGAGAVRRVGILRAHLEEDAGKLLHEAPGGRAIDFSIVDYNRAGAPLLEIVTHPDLRSSDEAVAFCRMLRDVCRFVGATQGVMQKGHIRFEPNINCELALRDGRLVRTPIVEVKNLNSFRAVKGAIEAERRDQPARWAATGLEHGPGAKQTRGFDERAMGEAGGGPGVGGATVMQREKEDAHDYRYFPDPDLPVLVVEREWVERIAATLPAMPAARARQCVADGLTAKEAAALVAEPEDCVFFEAVRDDLLGRGLTRARAAKAAAILVLQSGLKRANERAAIRPPRPVAALGDGARAGEQGVDPPEGSSASHRSSGQEHMEDQDAAGDDDAGPSVVLVSSLGITPRQVADIAAMREDGRLSAANADALFGLLCEPRMAGVDAMAVAVERGLLTVRDDAAQDRWIEQVMAENAAVVEQVKAGKMQAIGRLVGAAMKLSGGTGDAKAIRERLMEKMGVKE